VCKNKQQARKGVHYFMKKLLFALGTLALLGILMLAFAVGAYNTLNRQDEKINQAFAQVENQLKRRNDLIPNLVSATKGYVAHEQEVFKAIADARAKMGGAKTDLDKMKAGNEMTSALSRLMVIVENYPNLKADSQFLQLSDELAGTENRIAVARMDYNKSVEVLNGKVRTFPSNVIAGVFNIGKRDYFETPETEKAVPKVEF